VSDLVRVRLAEQTDLPVVGDITVDAYVADGFLTVGDDYAEHLRDAAGRARIAELWVAELDGAVVGSVTFCPPGSPQREVAREDEGEFRMLAVAPSARGRGVARALVQRCFERCRELGLEAIAICSLPQMVAAHALYGGLGFDRADELDWSPVDGVELWGFRAPVHQPSSGLHQTR
jgi:GNAT superfamily N-acetyltransferase